MKIEKYAGSMKGKEGAIKTSGGGNFEGYIGGYDRESNTISVWNGFKRTRVDADKIVSVNITPPFMAIVVIAAFVGLCFFLLDTTKSSNRYNSRSTYSDRYYGDYNDYEVYRRRTYR